MDKSKQNGHGERPVFDWDNISYKMFRDLGRFVSELSEINIRLNAQTKEDATPRDIKNAQNDRLKAFSDSVIVQDKRDDLLRGIILDLPRSWLIKNAPEKIESGQHLDFMRSNLFDKLTVELMNQNNEEREEIKN